MVAYGVVTIWLYPILIDPLFNKFERLPNGTLRSQVLQLAGRAGVDVGQVYRVDASRRTNAVNAYVIGLGHSKRVVLYDNLIDDFPRREVLGVVAHELGHQKHNDLMHGLVLARHRGARRARSSSRRSSERFSGRERLGTPGGLARDHARRSRWSGLGLGCASNALSRKVEANADQFSLELTHDPNDFIRFQRRIAIENVGDPDPPGVVPRPVRHAPDDARAHRRGRGVPRQVGCPAS